MNETTFQTRRESYNIDLTIINKLLVPTTSDWKISEEESCSDHNLIIYSIGQGHCSCKKDSFHGKRYVMKEEYFANFDEIVNNRIIKEFQQYHFEGTTEILGKLQFERTKEKKKHMQKYQWKNFRKQSTYNSQKAYKWGTR